MANKKRFFSNKTYGICEIELIKWGVVAWTLFLVTVWPWLRNLVLSVNWYIWLGLGVLFMIKPLIKRFK